MLLERSIYLPANVYVCFNAISTPAVAIGSDYKMVLLHTYRPHKTEIKWHLMQEFVVIRIELNNNKQRRELTHTFNPFTSTQRAVSLSIMTLE